MAVRPDPTKFRVSSALKTIIGKELITDDFIAVFELVKNAFDAHATCVDVFFNRDQKGDGSLVISDDGKGMDKTDLVEKWLFVAYSAKRDGTEDYRDKIQSKRIAAGAKGIGRFSCDKLGSHLSIYTKKRRERRFHKLQVNWADFEEDPKKEFMKIGVKYGRVARTPRKIQHGTILEITGLRECWDRTKLLKLKQSLEKLINPNQANDARNFSIVLHAKEEAAEDKRVPSDEFWNRVNGKIENRIFETLGIKTTQIITTISADGEHVTTTLTDRGQLIYETEEVNPYPELLHDITIHLFALNQSAKTSFTRAMGVQPVQYGSIFLFKNGFRIYPFGEVTEDTLGIDRRKQQGQARHFGTRDIIGRIEINGIDNNAFRETSSRDGGLIKNASYEALRTYFYDFALRRLERFAIGVIKWGNVGDLFEQDTSTLQDAKDRIFDVVKNLTKSKRVLDIRYDPKLLNILENRSQDSVSALLKNFQRMAQQSKSPMLAREVRKAKKHLAILAKAREEAEEEAQEARKDADRAEEEAEKASREAESAQAQAREAEAVAQQKTSENLFLQSMMSQDVTRLVSLHHHIGISAGTIENHVKNLNRKITNREAVTPEVIQLTLERISYQAKMISSTVKFATKANFNLEAAEIKADVVSFVKEYTINVCAGIMKAADDIDIEFKEQQQGSFEMVFKPIQMSIIIDNLFSNSKKAGARKICVAVTSATPDLVEFTFTDNGKGILKKNAKKIYDLGFTTTDGSGLGLYHVSQIAKEMDGEISLNTAYRHGAEFIVRFRK
jgi:signal transduction histidine kinase